MRLAVLSDIHGNLTALEIALADLQALGGADHTWILGDLAAFGPYPSACVQRVQALKEVEWIGKLEVIGGNTERYLVNGTRPRWGSAKEADDLPKLVQRLEEFNAAVLWSLKQLTFEDYDFLKKIRNREVGLQVDEYGFVIGYHGGPGDDEKALLPDTPANEVLDALLDREGRLGIGGHTHRQMDRDLGRWRVVNVGSVGMAFDQPGHICWGYFVFENGSVNVDLRALPYDMESMIAEVKAANNPIAGFIERNLRQA